MLGKQTALLQLLGLLSLCRGRGGPDTFLTYKPYPDSAKAVLAETVKKLQKDAPQVMVMCTLPGRDMLDHLQQVAVRNSYQNPLFKLDLTYMMEDGFNIGCRSPKKGFDPKKADGRFTDHHFNSKGSHDKKDMCNKHCTHKGRYCPAFPKDELEKHSKQDGRDLVLEVLRRLCMADLFEYGYSDPIFFDYVNKFQKMDCHEKDDMAECSKNILKYEIGESHGLDVTNSTKWINCVKEAEADSDKTNPLLEDSLDASLAVKKEMNYTVQQMPIMTIGDEKWSGSARADKVQNRWCSYFKGDVKPVSCYFCAETNNMKSCLWHLSNGRAEFDIKTYKDPKTPHANTAPKPHATATAPPVPAHVAGPTAPAPAPTADQEKGNGHGKGKGKGNKQGNHENESTLQIVEDDVEVVADATMEILAAGVGIGLAVSGLLWCLVEWKRKRAVAEVAMELPTEGFKDSDDGFKDEDDTIELHEIS